jgi:uncharacterized UBP type Zn finger protein
MHISNPESLLFNSAVVPEEEKVKTLVEMGFREDYAKVALIKTHNAMQASTEYLINTSEEDLEKEKEIQEKSKTAHPDTSSISSMIARISQLEAMSSQLQCTIIIRPSESVGSNGPPADR